MKNFLISHFYFVYKEIGRKFSKTKTFVLGCEVYRRSRAHRFYVPGPTYRVPLSFRLGHFSRPFAPLLKADVLMPVLLTYYTAATVCLQFTLARRPLRPPTLLSLMHKNCARKSSTTLRTENGYTIIYYILLDGCTILEPHQIIFNVWVSHKETRLAFFYRHCDTGLQPGCPRGSIFYSDTCFT